VNTDTRINLDAMYDTTTAGELMGGISRRTVIDMIRSGMISGRYRPAVRRKEGAKAKEQMVVPGTEIVRFNQQLKPVDGGAAEWTDSPKVRPRRKQARASLPGDY